MTLKIRHAAMAAVATLGLATATPVLADPPGHAKAHGYHKKGKNAYRQGFYDGQRDAQRINGNTRVWRGDDGRYYCRRDNGTTGLLIGGAVGGLIGNEVAGRGDKTLGTLLGAAGGALLGREIDRDRYRCR